jgi:uncharacterized membrane protein YhaH (DUF805 family)
VGVAVLVHAGVIVAGGFAWHLLLQGAGGRVPAREVMTVYGLAQFAKYLPGNVAHHVGRVGLARTRGVPVPMAVATMGVETVLVIGIAVALAAVAVIRSGGQLGELLPATAALGHHLWAVVAGLAGLVAAMALVGRRVLRSGCAGEAALSCLPPASAVPACVAIYGLTFVAMGLVLALLAGGVFDSPQGNLLTLTSLFALSWVAGFVTPGAPAGLGVREAILVTVLRPIYGEPVSVGLSLVLRLVTTAGDGLGFLLALAGRRRWLSAPGPVGDA